MTSTELMVTVTEVIDFHGVKPKNLGYSKDDVDQLNETIEKWIIQCQSLICEYTHNKFKDNVPETVKNVCIRLVSNMIQLAVARRDSPIIKSDDWTYVNMNSKIFTDDLKEDLSPFVKDYSTKSDNIDIFAITGD